VLTSFIMANYLLKTILLPSFSSRDVARGQRGTDVPGRQTKGDAKIGLNFKIPVIEKFTKVKSIKINLI